MHKKEAEEHLKRGAAIYEDFEDHFDDYMNDWDIEEEYRAEFRAMIDDREPVGDWGIVEDAGKMYYIQYVL